MPNTSSSTERRVRRVRDILGPAIERFYDTALNEVSESDPVENCTSKVGRLKRVMRAGTAQTVARIS